MPFTTESLPPEVENGIGKAYEEADVEEMKAFSSWRFPMRAMIARMTDKVVTRASPAAVLPRGGGDERWYNTSHEIPRDVGDSSGLHRVRTHGREMLITDGCRRRIASGF